MKLQRVIGIAGAVWGLLATACATGCARPDRDPASQHALARDGYAQLENEDPAAAVETFTTLRERLSGDPLPHGNLALALLRSEHADEAQLAIDAGLERFPDQPDLLAIRTTIQHWRGEAEAALDSIRTAAELAPEDPEIQFGLYRIAEQVGSAGDVTTALERLSRLRPENLVVLLTLGKTALANAADDPEPARAEASRVYLRIRELAWDNPQALGVLERLLQALSDNLLQETRTPAIQLENLLKITPAYKHSLRELETGIQGIPLRNLATLPEPAPDPDPAALSFLASSISTGAHDSVGVVFADEQPLAMTLARDGESWTLGTYALGVPGSAEAATREGVRADGSQFPQHLLLADVDNDGSADALVSGPRGVQVFARDAEGGLSAWDETGIDLDGAVHQALALDYDIEGDLDLALATESGVRLFRNALDGPLIEVTEHAGALASDLEVDAIHASDLDLDGDLDLVGSEDGKLVWWPNLRQGEFGRHELQAVGGFLITSADFDNDGRFELVVAAPEGVRVLRFEGGTVTPHAELAVSGTRAAAIGDLDADGQQDLVVGGASGVTVFQNTGGGFADPLTVFEQPVNDLALVDDDRDCDLDLLVAGDAGLHRLETHADPAYHCLRVRLRGLTEGSSKNNVLGSGSLVEIAVGDRTLTTEVRGEESFAGLGSSSVADLLRVVWTNGVPQNRFDLAGDATVVEEQLLKGSCPFLYAWNGERFAFVTDLLWGSPAGLPVAPGVWAGADPSELVHIPQAVPKDGKLELRVTEELWEAAFFDHLRLWVVEVDADLEVASSLRILPGRSTPERVLATAEVRPVVEARDARGRDVTAIVSDRDETYADGWEMSGYQGVPARPWSFEFDLGDSPDEPVRLLLDGWIFPSDASLNLALAQRRDPTVHGPRVEVLVRGRWRTLAEDIGFPAGKTKTMVVDLPRLPRGASRLRLVAAQWLSFDRIAWSTRIADDTVRMVERKLPTIAELRYRGYSRLVRRAPNAPHSFDYHRVNHRAPWLPFPGRYTRYGDVRELLAAADDRSVILAAGDEMRLVFDLDLPPATPGRRYEYFLESHGWDKDADRNTWQAAQVEPLPFRAMSGYPYGPGEQFPDSPEHRAYRSEWLTRVVGSR